MTDVAVVADALKRTQKGMRTYDSTWEADGRGRGFLKCLADDVAYIEVIPNYDPEEFMHQDGICGNSFLNGSLYMSSPEHGDESLNSSAVSETESERSKPPELNLSPELVQTELAIEDYEHNRLKKVQEKIDAQKKTLEHQFNIEFLKTLQKSHVLEKTRIERQQHAEKEKQENEMRLREIEEKKHQQLKEQHQIKAKLLSEKIRNAELQHKAKQEEMQRKMKLQEELKMKLGSCCKEIEALIKQTEQRISSSASDNKELNKLFCHWQNQLEQLSNQVHQLKSSEELSEVDAQKAEMLRGEVHNFVQEIFDSIEQANLQLVEAKRSVKPTPQANSVKENEDSKETNETKKREDCEGLEVLIKCVDSEALKEYIELKDFYKKIKNAYQPLISDPQYKKYKFELQKAINTPVNAISAYSGAHLRDKFERLLALVSGQMVEVGEKRVNCKQHPQAIFYCMDLLAKKLVTQGEGQVASKFETAFPVATVVVGLWAKFPELGRLILHHFYERCPYLLPYYIPREEGQSEEDYYKALGYIYVDDVAEKQDKFLKRMSGYLRLYAAIIQSSPPPGVNIPNPHGIEYGWRWLARMLNLEPRPDISATLLFDFLEVAGHAMEEAYGKQFQKLLHALCKDFFPQIKKVTPVGGGGPVTRLEDFLQKVVRQRRIQPPDGLLKPNFWNTF